MSSASSPAAAAALLPTAPIANIAALREAMASLAEKANLVSPFVGMDYVPAMHRVSFRSVLIDASLREVKRGDYTMHIGTDTYFDPKFCEPNERALSKTGILKLFRAAGVDLVSSTRIDDRSDPRNVEWTVKIEVPELDGRRSTIAHTKAIDLRPGSPAREQMTDKQAKQAERAIQENAETKALLRAGRAALQLMHKYTVEQLAKPFVVPVLVPDLDTNDPEIKRMVAASALGITEQLYGARALGPATRVIDGERVDTETGEVLGAEAMAADFPDLPGEQSAPGPTCRCPCGCRESILQEIADMTTRQGGSARCGACWPSPLYDEARHAHLEDLGLTKPLDPKRAAVIAAEKRAKAGGAR